MKVHHKTAHGESIAKVETTCSAKDCTNEFECCPSLEEGQFCEDCIEESDVAHRPDRKRPPNLFDSNEESPEQYYDDNKEKTGFSGSNVGDI